MDVSKSLKLFSKSIYVIELTFFFLLFCSILPTFIQHNITHLFSIALLVLACCQLISLCASPFIHSVNTTLITTLLLSIVGYSLSIISYEKNSFALFLIGVILIGLGYGKVLALSSQDGSKSKSHYFILPLFAFLLSFIFGTLSLNLYNIALPLTFLWIIQLLYLLIFVAHKKSTKNSLLFPINQIFTSKYPILLQLASLSLFTALFSFLFYIPYHLHSLYSTNTIIYILFSFSCTALLSYLFLERLLLPLISKTSLPHILVAIALLSSAISVIVANPILKLILSYLFILCIPNSIQYHSKTIDKTHFSAGFNPSLFAFYLQIPIASIVIAILTLTISDILIFLIITPISLLISHLSTLFLSYHTKNPNLEYVSLEK